MSYSISYGIIFEFFGLTVFVLYLRGKIRKKEETRQKQEREEMETKKRIENEIAETAARKEAQRQAVECRLPQEPVAGLGEQTKIRFRLPKGKNVERRFTADTSLRVRNILFMATQFLCIL